MEAERFSELNERYFGEGFERTIDSVEVADCDKCGCLIPRAKKIDHIDYHERIELEFTRLLNLAVRKRTRKRS